MEMIEFLLLLLIFAVLFPNVIRVILGLAGIILVIAIGTAIIADKDINTKQITKDK